MTPKATACHLQRKKEKKRKLWLGQVFKVSISSTQTILIHCQDMVIQNKRKLYSEPPFYCSMSDRARKNEALLNGQRWFLFVLIFPLRTVIEVTEWVFKGLLNARMNKSWPLMSPFQFPFSGVVEEITWELLGDPPLLSKPEVSIVLATEWLHIFLATAFPHC